MARLFLIFIVFIVALVITALKNVAGSVTDNRDWANAKVRDEARDLMDRTARGIEWLESQWDDSRERVDSLRRDPRDRR